MLRMLGLLLLVSGLVAAILLAAAARLEARSCSYMMLDLDSFVLPRSSSPTASGNASVIILSFVRQLNFVEAEGFQYSLMLSLSPRLIVVCYPLLPPPNATPAPPAILTPKVVNATVKGAKFYALRTADFRVVEAAVAASMQPDYILELLEKRAIAKVELAERQPPGTWGGLPTEILEVRLDASVSSYQGVLAVQAEMEEQLSNCTSMELLGRLPVLQACKVSAPTFNQYLRSLLIALLGLLTIAYDSWRSGAQAAKWLSRALYTLRRAGAQAAQQRRGAIASGG